jgi:hypothetical protein
MAVKRYYYRIEYYDNYAGYGDYYTETADGVVEGTLEEAEAYAEERADLYDGGIVVFRELLPEEDFKGLIIYRPDGSDYRSTGRTPNPRYGSRRGPRGY